MSSPGGAINDDGAGRPFRTPASASTAAGAAQASHCVFYGFGTIAWRRIGFDDTVIGMLWTLGVVAEIGLFWIAGRLGRFGSAPVLLALAGIGVPGP